MKGHVHSIQSLGTVDGPGVRTVVFTEGCPLRCVYCHNPDTWDRSPEHLREASDVAEQILRFYPYIKNGGVTFSGGEPCLEAAFLCELSALLKKRRLHLALDTSGAVYNDDVEALLGYIDLVLLDIKMVDEESYGRYIGGSLSRTLDFLRMLEARHIPVTVRHVVVPGINDNEESILALGKIVAEFDNVQAVELLPYKNLCLEKYEKMGIDFALKDTPPMGSASLERLRAVLSEASDKKILT